MYLITPEIEKSAIFQTKMKLLSVLLFICITACHGEYFICIITLFHFNAYTLYNKDVLDGNHISSVCEHLQLHTRKNISGLKNSDIC
jgi:hypothetical protein